MGNIFSQDGRAQEAIAHYKEALRINPTYSQAHNGLGNLLSQMGDMPEAIAEFELAFGAGAKPVTLALYLNIVALAPVTTHEPV